VKNTVRSAHLLRRGKAQKRRREVWTDMIGGAGSGPVISEAAAITEAVMSGSGISRRTARIATVSLSARLRLNNKYRPAALLDRRGR
jgi:hypothetical protein